MSVAAIIPVRNRAALVAEAIASTQRQTRPVDEIIIVDDGSTDSTADIVTRLSHQDSRIRLITLPKHSGASAARNAGIEATQCSYICFLDSDDQWMPRKNELQLYALTSTPKAIASFTGIRYQRHNWYSEVNAPEQITLKELRKRNYLGTTSTAMIRRDVLLQVGGFDRNLPSCQDWDLWIRLRRVAEFSIVPQPLVIYNQVERARISKDKESVFAGHAQLFARALEDVSDYRERRMIIAYHQLRLSEIYLLDFKEPSSAMMSASKSLMLYPTRKGVGLLLAAIRANTRKLCGIKEQLA